ncbi:unnamed protein product [Rotaria sp. Silwood1]|nr:unnamed protein product [Rotaria sp. Silwood1]CAF4937494.1 unnamed protein product [Rotaria sp. Silwood1]CAF5036272.1 unnamed protein product [Rotaria sp. Silwood1]
MNPKINIQNVEKFIHIFDNNRLLKVLHIEVNDTYPFPVLRLLLHEMKSLRFISIKSDTFKYEVEEILALLKEVLNGIEYQVNIKRDILSIWF